MNTISRRTLVGLIVGIALSVGPARLVAGAGAAGDSTDKIAGLRAAALGDDFDKSMTALRQLAAGGPPASAALGEVVSQLVTRDSATIEAEAPAAIAQLPKLVAEETEMAPLQAAALETIDKFTGDAETLKAARRNYAKLSNTEVKLTLGYARQMRVLQAAARRAECLALAPSTHSPSSGQAGSGQAPQGKPAPRDADQLTRVAGQALGMPADVAAKFLAGPLDPPAEAAQRPLWFYVVSRRIEAWNQPMEPALNAAEIAHLRRVNYYRELLGLVPYELDLRLIQSARRHSKEMMELWYFSHYSPTESLRSPFTRMARAGYAEGSNENITMGSWTGDDAFWQFFNSPDHHRAWTDRDGTCIGVGKWEFAWTQDIGAGRRLMTADEDQRAKAVVLGTELKPQAVELTRRHPRDMATIKFYDESGQEMQQATGIERKTGVRTSP